MKQLKKASDIEDNRASSMYGKLDYIKVQII